jgi:hypothetical protein
MVEEKENRHLYRPFETSWQGRKCHEIDRYGWWDFGLGTFSNRAAVFTMEAKMLLRMKKRKWHSRLHMMTMFIVFCDSQGFMYYDSGSRGQTVNQGFSLSILQCLREAVWKKQLELLQEHGCFIMTALHCIQKLLTKNKNQVFSLLSSPADTYLFPELKVSVMGCQCESVEEIQDTPLEQLTQISSRSYMEC